VVPVVASAIAWLVGSILTLLIPIGALEVGLGLAGIALIAYFHYSLSAAEASRNVAAASTEAASAIDQVGTSAESTGKSLYEDLCEAFDEVYADAKKTGSDILTVWTGLMGDLSAAFARGDLESAMKLIWEGIKVTWLEGTNFIMEKTEELQDFLSEVKMNAAETLMSWFSPGANQVSNPDELKYQKQLDKANAEIGQRTALKNRLEASPYGQTATSLYKNNEKYLAEAQKRKQDAERWLAANEKSDSKDLHDAQQKTIEGMKAEREERLRAKREEAKAAREEAMNSARTSLEDAKTEAWLKQNEADWKAKRAEEDAYWESLGKDDIEAVKEKIMAGAGGLIGTGEISNIPKGAITGPEQSSIESMKAFLEAQYEMQAKDEDTAKKSEEHLAAIRRKVEEGGGLAEA